MQTTQSTKAGERTLKYRALTFRSVGLESKWGKTRAGAPIIFARKNGSSTWFAVDANMWKAMQAEGVMEAFERFTLLGDIFSVPA